MYSVNDSGGFFFLFLNKIGALVNSVLWSTSLLLLPQATDWQLSLSKGLCLQWCTQFKPVLRPESERKRRKHPENQIQIPPQSEMIMSSYHTWT